MKYYETTFEDHLAAARGFNMHAAEPVPAPAPACVSAFKNTIVYGPPGVGKYTQALLMLAQYSPSGLKYENHITIVGDKQKCEYRISDIHCEVDMALLGCNSKTLWAELFGHVAESVATKRVAVGVILCKNFHATHPELLDVFYSYMQQYAHPTSPIQIRFLLLTEHIGFVADDIVARCDVRPFARPAPETYAEMICRNCARGAAADLGVPPRMGGWTARAEAAARPRIAAAVHTNTFKSCKELYQYTANVQTTAPTTDAIFAAVVAAIDRADTLTIVEIREVLYDILIYGEDVAEIVWRLVAHYTAAGPIHIDAEFALSLFKHTNNAYREIFHLEKIFFMFLEKLSRQKSNT
jgi:hypothetical protein